MTNYERIKNLSIEEMAAVFYAVIKPFLDNEDLERIAKVQIMSMLREEVKQGRSSE